MLLGQPRAITVLEETHLQLHGRPSGCERGVVGRRCLGADQARIASCSCGHGQDLSLNSRFTILLPSSVWLLGTGAVGIWAEDNRATGLTAPLGVCF